VAKTFLKTNTKSLQDFHALSAINLLKTVINNNNAPVSGLKKDMKYNY